MKKQQGENITHINTLLQVVREKNGQQNEVDRDVKSLEAQLYNMEEKLNIKEEIIKKMQVERQKVDGRIIHEHRMVNNLRGQLDTLQKDMKLMEQEMKRLKNERNAARQAADSRDILIQRLQHELMITNQLKKNCESVIRHLNESRDQATQQAQADLSDLLKQYIQLKQTVCDW